MFIDECLLSNKQVHSAPCLNQEKKPAIIFRCCCSSGQPTQINHFRFLQFYSIILHSTAISQSISVFVSSKNSSINLFCSNVKTHQRDLRKKPAEISVLIVKKFSTLNWPHAHNNKTSSGVSSVLFTINFFPFYSAVQEKWRNSRDESAALLDEWTASNFWRTKR